MKYKYYLLFALIFSVSFSIVLAEEKIQAKTFVNDYANIIDESTESQLNQILNEIYNSGTAEYSIVTINSLEGKDIESYALNLAQNNLGDKTKNNGLLLLVAVEDRQYRFEVGRGLEQYLTDLESSYIGRDYIETNFKNQDYNKGILDSTLEIQKILFGEIPPINKAEQKVNFKPLIFIIIFFIIFILSMFYKIWIFKQYNKKMKDKKYFKAAKNATIFFGGWGIGRSMGGSPGGIGSDGFGGFGGGSFGGGGASGRW
ncbi:TPM domain-containing protein [Candidatus Woesearchaeota archaeon]|nr:TPM domain-containing protein [Candidatus Woesearchaeota archaeon]